MTESLSAAEQIFICQQLTRLKGMYCRLVDTKDWAGFAALFADDATLDFRGSTSTSIGNTVLQGSSVIVETIRDAVSAITTVHQCHTPEFEILSPTLAKATGIWLTICAGRRDRRSAPETATDIIMRPTGRSTESGNSFP